MLKDLILDNKKFTIIKTIIIIIALIIIKIIAKKMQVNINTRKIQENTYIQNLEQKLNIYEQEYDEFALKDAIEQGDSYE